MTNVQLIQEIRIQFKKKLPYDVWDRDKILQILDSAIIEALLTQDNNCYGDYVSISETGTN
jgi:hypothetical protein